MAQPSFISAVTLISPNHYYIDRISIRNAERLNDKDSVNHYRSLLSAQSEKLNAQIEAKEKQTKEIEAEIKHLLV